MDESQSQPQPEPSSRLGVTSNLPQPNSNSETTFPGNMSNADMYQIPNHFDGAPYGMMQYNGIPYPIAAANRDIGAVAVPNIYNFSVTPSPCNAAAVPQNHGPSDWLPASNSYGYIGHPGNEHGGNSNFMEHGRGSFKRKTAEGVPGNFQYLNASPGSTVVVGPLNPMHPESFARMDASYYPHYQYRGNDGHNMEPRGSNENVRSSSVSIGMDPARAHSNFHPARGSYITQPFQSVNSNHGDGGASPWNQVPAVPYVPGRFFPSLLLSHNNYFFILLMFELLSN